MLDNYYHEEQSLVRSSTPVELLPSELNAKARCLCEADGVDSERGSKLTVGLTNEHRTIIREIERLKATVAKSKVAYRSGDPMLFTQLAESLNEHFRKEEQFLFPIVDRSLGSSVCDRLNSEHIDVMNIAKNLSVQTRLLEESLNHLVELFRAHVSTEENVIFWYLDLQQPTE